VREKEEQGWRLKKGGNHALIFKTSEKGSSPGGRRLTSFQLKKNPGVALGKSIKTGKRTTDREPQRSNAAGIIREDCAALKGEARCK